MSCHNYLSKDEKFFPYFYIVWPPAETLQFLSRSARKIFSCGGVFFRKRALPFSVLQTLPIFGLAFSFSHLKSAVFSFSGLCSLQVFSSLVFGFQYCSFSDFSVQCILWFFLVLPRKLHPVFALRPSSAVPN